MCSSEPSLSHYRNVKRPIDQISDSDQNSLERPQHRCKRARRPTHSRLLTPISSESPPFPQTPTPSTPLIEQTSDLTTERDNTSAQVPSAAPATEHLPKQEESLSLTQLEPSSHEAFQSAAEHLPTQVKPPSPTRLESSFHEALGSVTEHLPTTEKPPSATKLEPSFHEALQSASVPSVQPTPPRTPYEHVYLNLVDDDFGRKVSERYVFSVWRDGFRRYRYGSQVAREWKQGSTPEEAREEWRAKLEHQQQAWDAISDTESDEDWQCEQER
ncbi:MAG: hypothetical protein Q9166_002573 [cf. Caloplaca sp. 2 TL-2023]